MSKLSFRSRQVDFTKPLPIYLSHDLPDLQDFAAINRSVPQMPTGMEKDEEAVRKTSQLYKHIVAFVHNCFLICVKRSIICNGPCPLCRLLATSHRMITRSQRPKSKLTTKCMSAFITLSAQSRSSTSGYSVSF